ncbi:LysR family transcriptional regulator, partial [Mycobacterium tuberculosis]|nr:LysR family transcriptional regulator [Mycobacterium tuberculosis]
MHKTTLEQWALLEKVVELGSFARAAEETNRSQSSVSYNLALLQERLGVALLAPWPLVRIADQGGDSQAPRDAWT